MSKYLSDTTILIDSLRGDSKARNFLEKYPSISAISFAEVVQGARDQKELSVVVRTCNALDQEKIDNHTTVLSIELLKKYNLSHGLLFLDALIAATCLIKKKTLITANVKDFKFIEGLELLSHFEVFKSLDRTAKKV